MEKPITINFSPGLTASGIRIQSPQDIPGSLQALGLDKTMPVIVLVGGAGGLDDSEYQRLSPLFTESIAPLAEEIGAAIIDGGTDSGIMALIGEAKWNRHDRFPLIGVAVEQMVTWPNRPNGDHQSPLSQRTALEAHHTHFLFVPGKEWGEESEWIFQIADVLAGSSPSVTVLINGGEIAFQDVELSLKHQRQVILVAGSGRTTDVLVKRVRDSVLDQGKIAPAASKLFTVAQMGKGSADLTSKLKRSLHIKE